ncbi:MAG TPA: hypothetical protein VEZ90_12875 [Blastocatellia bacterium]|nr:hypothetical protein [Blastocatellia bacterium]
MTQRALEGIGHGATHGTPAVQSRSALWASTLHDTALSKSTTGFGIIIIRIKAMTTG